MENKTNPAREDEALRAEFKAYFDGVEPDEAFRQRLLKLEHEQTASPKVIPLRRFWKPVAAAAVIAVVSLAGLSLLPKQERLSPSEPRAVIDTGAPEATLPPAASSETDTEPGSETAAPEEPPVPGVVIKPERPSTEPSEPPESSETPPAEPGSHGVTPGTNPSVPPTEPPATEPCTELPTETDSPPPEVTEPNLIESDIIETFPVPGGPAIETDEPGDPVPLDWPAEYVVENGRSLLRVTHPDTGTLWELDITDEMNDNVYNGDEIIFGQEVLISLYVYETGEYDLLLLPWQQP